MKLTIFGLVFALIAWPMPVAAKDPTLKGRVISSEKPPPQLWGGVRVKVKNKYNNREVGRHKITNDDQWEYDAPFGWKVDVLFDKSCYVPDGLYNIYVTREDPRQLETVELQKTKDCLIAEEQQQKRQSGKSSSRGRSTDDLRTTAMQAKAVVPNAGASFYSGPGVKSYASIRKNEPKVRVTPFPSPKTLKEDLQTEAKRARHGEFFDTFQYNFRVKWVVYSNVPRLVKTLWQFRTDDKNKDLFAQIGGVRPEAFDDVVRGQFQIPGEINFENIKTVITDASMSPSVRGSAAVAFLNIKATLPETHVEQVMAYFREQAKDSSSEIFDTAVVALARSGDDSDRQKLFEDIRSGTDQKRVIASMKALAVIQILEGPEPLVGGAETLALVAAKNENPILRATAFSSLRPFALRADETAIEALVKGAQNDDEEEKVRLYAILSLGTGDVEDDPRVRKALTEVARKDESLLLRRAASWTLSGMKWLPKTLIGALQF